MRLSQLRISNFRCFKETTVTFDDYTCFVGPNGAGKSTVLAALNVFFRETANVATDMVTLSEEDFHMLETSAPIRIELTFEDLGQEAQQDFADYFRNGKLIVAAVAEWNEATHSAPVKQFGQRLGIEAFRQYFHRDKTGAKANELQDIYARLRGQHPQLPIASTKQAKEDALRAYAVVPSADTNS